MIKAVNIRDFLFILIALYSAQGALYPNGTIISQVSLLILLLISGIYFLKTLLQKNENSFQNQ
jgi:hypothetical protein